MGMSALTKPAGCVDQNCALMPHAGMGVLGACKCLDDCALPGAEGSRARHKVRNALRWWQDRAEQAEKQSDRAPVEALERIAAALDLTLPTERENAVSAIVLDIGRLLDVQKRWLEACSLARTHCPVGDGESHVRQGIPRLAKRAASAEETLATVRRLVREDHGRVELAGHEENCALVGHWDEDEVTTCTCGLVQLLGLADEKLGGGGR